LTESVVSKLWVEGSAHSIFIMTAHQNHAFMQLLSAWRRREDARSTGTLADLADARKSLDSARNDMHATLSGLR
jgi:hypothetical protein